MAFKKLLRMSFKRKKQKPCIDTSGYITKKELRVLEESRKRERSSRYQRRKCLISTCLSCSFKMYYKVLKCPECESSQIEHGVYKAKYSGEEEFVRV